MNGHDKIATRRHEKEKEVLVEWKLPGGVWK